MKLFVSFVAFISIALSFSFIGGIQGSPGANPRKYLLEDAGSTNEEPYSDQSFWDLRDFISVQRLPADFRIYVSSSTGSDSNDGLHPGRPVFSIHRALNIIHQRTLPFQIGNFHLLFKRGDLFVGENLGLPVTGGDGSFYFSGPDALHPILISGYGSGDRPRISGDVGRILRLWTSARNIIVKGIEFNPVRRDISRPEFDYFSADQFGIEMMFGASHIRVEDCVLRNLLFGFYVSDGSENLKPNHIRIVRNSIAYNWANSLINYNNRAFGIIGGGFRNVKILENLFLRNGWHPLLHTAIRTGYSHNLYLSGSAENLEIESNWSIEGSSMGLKMRSEGTYAYTDFSVRRNVFIGNAIGIGMGVGPAPNQMQFANFSVNENLITNGGVAGELPPYGTTNWGITFGSGISGSISNNLLVQNTQISNAIAIRLDPFFNADMTVTGNMIHRFGVYSGISNDSLSGMNVYNNVVESSESSYRLQNPDYSIFNRCDEAGFGSCNEMYEFLLARAENVWGQVYNPEATRAHFVDAYRLID